LISKGDIDSAFAAISDQIVDTPVIHSRTLSEMCGCHTLFKLENLQMTGAFKERGALTKLLSLSPEQRDSGVIAGGGGNHAQGVAYHCQRLGINATIVMPLGTPLIKVWSSQNYGAEIILHGDSYDDAQDLATEMGQSRGLVPIHPFNDPLVIAGQGTIAVEILRHRLCQGLDAVLCPVGGGGLISGIAAYIKEINPSISVIGVEAKSCPALQRALQNGSPVELESASSLADGIAVKRVGDLTYNIVEKYVDEVVSVDEEEIAHAILLLLEIEKIVVEGAGAVTLAALVNRKVSLEGKKVLSVISGGNIDVNILSRIISRGLSVDRRIVQVRMRIRDVPGALKDALEICSDLGTNIIDIIHHRFEPSVAFGYMDVSVTLETKGAQHADEVEQTLTKNGYIL